MCNSATLAAYMTLLSLPGYRITNYRKEPEGHVFHLAPDEVVACPHCKRACQRRQKRNAKRPIADLPVFGEPVRLFIRRDQYQCSSCGACFTPACTLIAPNTWVTQRLLEHAAKLIQKSDIAQVAELLGLPERSLGRWYYQYLERQQVDALAADRQPIRALGIDELSLKKRHRQYVAVIVDHTNGCVLEVLEYRNKARVKAYLSQLKAQGALDQLEEVSCDMWDGYANAVYETLPQVKVSIDRFHVMKAFQDQLTKARRAVQRELSAEEAKALKGSRWWWVTNDENLDPVSRRELAALKRRFPRLAALHDQRERLRAIFENPRHTVQSGRACLEQWMEQARALGLKALDAFCGTLERWMEGIAQYFARRTTNGRTEGFNRGLRAILWRACGMTNFGHFRLRVLHAFGPNRPNTPASENVGN